MIRVNVFKDNNKNINRITINGHAMYAPYGKDIVCAAVSSTTITTINNILTISKTIDYKEEKDGLTITVIKSDEVTYKLLNNMLSMLSEIENDYPKHIKINEEV
jgi:uncharacterized protein YsxB (DUF464 family)